jgi:hypothetical protein
MLICYTFAYLFIRLIDLCLVLFPFPVLMKKLSENNIFYSIGFRIFKFISLILTFYTFIFLVRILRSGVLFIMFYDKEVQN